MLVTLNGMEILVKLLQFLKALPPIFFIPDGKIILIKLLQFSKVEELVSVKPA